MIHHGPGFMPYAPFHIFWLVFAMAAIVAGIVLVLIWALRASSRPAYPMGPPPPPSTMAARETPLDILARRFASGEITAEEYQHARDLLGGGKT